MFFSYICMRVFFIHLYACFCHTFVCVFVCGFFFIHLYVVFFHTFACVFFSYICMRVFLIHLYAILYACFCHSFECVFVCLFFIHLYAGFFSYICMRVFFINLYAILYACLFHTFLHLYLGWPWRSGECGRPITRGLAVQSPLTAQQKNYQCSTHSHDSSPETFLLAYFFHTFVCGFLSYICLRFCMRVFFIHFYISILVGRGAVVSVVVQ